MNFFKKISPGFVSFFIILYLLFTLTGCPPKPAKKILEETTPKETVEESEEEVKEIVVEETPEKEKCLSKEEFLEHYIKNYNIISQATVYAEIEYEIALDWSEGKITKEEASIKYLQLATQVGKDFFLVDIVLKARPEKFTAEQKHIIELIREWSTKKKHIYKYYSDYLDTGQAAYEIKTDELKEETDKIHDEYVKAIKEYREK